MGKRRKKEWFDNDAFWKETYPFMFPEHRFTDTPGHIEKVLRLTRNKGKHVLDLCCGPGRCAIVLAESGFQVTGVDRTEYLLNIARKKALEAKVDVEWVQEDMRDFVRKLSYDLVLSMYTSFGYFDQKDQDVQVLDNIIKSLKPDGACIIEVMGKEILAGIFSPTTSEVLPDGTQLVQRHEIFDDWTRIQNEWILLRKGKAKKYRFHHTIYSGQELKDRMEQVGFVDIRLYGNLEGDAYGPDADRLIIVGHKAV